MVIARASGGRRLPRPILNRATTRFAEPDDWGCPMRQPSRRIIASSRRAMTPLACGATDTAFAKRMA